ncbi:hypothetical protein PMAYCL1PPCAC_29934, partial [Pristionchus mayeri]
SWLAFCLLIEMGSADLWNSYFLNLQSNFNDQHIAKEDTPPVTHSDVSTVTHSTSLPIISGTTTKAHAISLFSKIGMIMVGLAFLISVIVLYDFLRRGKKVVVWMMAPSIFREKGENSLE